MEGSLREVKQVLSEQAMATIDLNDEQSSALKNSITMTLNSVHHFMQDSLKPELDGEVDMIDAESLNAQVDKFKSIQDSGDELLADTSKKQLDGAKLGAFAEDVSAVNASSLKNSGMLDQSFNAVMSQAGVSEDLEENAVNSAKRDMFEEVAAATIDTVAPGLGTVLKESGVLSKAYDTINRQNKDTAEASLATSMEQSASTSNSPQFKAT